jgi:cytochrome c2
MKQPCHPDPERSEGEGPGREGGPALTPRSLATLGMTCLLLFASCTGKKYEHAETQAITGGGNPDRGQLLITQYGCTACHSIPGIEGPKGAIGPPLDRMALRTFIAGKVQNTPQNMITWLQNPQAFDPANAMPNLGVKPEDARDIAAYLFTLK